jgi:hypothetical protein
MAGRCLGMLSRLLTAEVMERAIRRVVPLLGSSDNECRRQGAIEAIACKCCELLACGCIALFSWQVASNTSGTESKILPSVENDLHENGLPHWQLRAVELLRAFSSNSCWIFISSWRFCFNRVECILGISVIYTFDLYFFSSET